MKYKCQSQPWSFLFSRWRLRVYIPNKLFVCVQQIVCIDIHVCTCSCESSYVYVCLWVWVYVSVHACVWKPGLDILYLPQSPIYVILCFECLFLFMCLCICIAMYGCLWRPEGSFGSLDLGFQAGGRCLMWVLRSELLSSARAAGTLNH